MDVDIGLPGHLGDVDGPTLLEWARRAEQRGFSTISVSDRLVWTTPEPVVTLAAVAAATSRIRLLTSILLAPLRSNHTLFAKQLATLDRLAGAGRLRIGLAPGLRKDDFEVSGVDFASRGRQFDALVEGVAHVWSSADGVGPAPVTDGGPELLFGGVSEAAVRRIVSEGSGWIAGDATTAEVDAFAPGPREAWRTAGRPGTPTVIASVMYALGPGARDAVSKALSTYYAFGGQEYVDYGIDIAYTTAERVAAAVGEFERAGCDELIFMGNDTDPDQVDLLADALGI